MHLPETIEGGEVVAESAADHDNHFNEGQHNEGEHKPMQTLGCIIRVPVIPYLCE